MPVVCYQIAEFEQEQDQPVLAVNTYSLSAPDTNLEKLLRLVAPSVKALGPTSSIFDPAYRYELAAEELPAAVALLRSHEAPSVTAITRCALSVCLDFYQHPDTVDGPDGSVTWKKTDVGSQVHASKYRGRARQIGPALAARVADFVLKHPLLSSAVGVAPIPSSKTLGPAKKGLVPGIAEWVSRELEIPVVRLERVSLPDYSQKNLPKGADPDANQANSMQAHLDRAGLVLVLDDLMRDASTVNEAARALTEAGAGTVTSLTLVKERTGTRGYRFS